LAMTVTIGYHTHGGQCLCHDCHNRLSYT